MVWWALAAAAWAGGADRLAVSIGAAGMGSAGTAGPLGAAYLSVRTTAPDAARPLFLDVGARTGLLGGPTREVTGVSVGGRLGLGQTVFVRADLVHQHESPWDAFVSAPVATMFGTGEAIGHRSGLDAGLGLRHAVTNDGPPITVSAAALATWFPDPNGPHLYGVIEALISVDLGRAAP